MSQFTRFIRRPLARVAPAFVALALGTGSTFGDPAMIAEFSAAVSQGDAEIAARTQALIATPPTTVEEIGYYGLKNAPEGERVLRGVISTLGRAGYFYQFEDKYIGEMVDVLIEAGVLAGDGDDAVLNPVMALYDAMDDEGAIDYGPFRAGFPAHVAALEAAAAAAGNVLLSLDLGIGGDTFLLWPAAPEVAARWRGVVLYEGPNATPSVYSGDTVTIRVTGPDWQRYWSFLTYALDIPDELAGFPGPF